MFAGEQLNADVVICLIEANKYVVPWNMAWCTSRFSLSIILSVADQSGSHEFKTVCQKNNLVTGTFKLPMLRMMSEEMNLVFTDFSLFILLFFTSSFGGLQQPREGTALSFEVLNYTVIFLKTAAPYLFGSTFYRWPVFTHYTAKGNYVLPFQIYTAHKICLLKFRHFHQWAYNQFPVFAAFFFFFFSCFWRKHHCCPDYTEGSASFLHCGEVVGRWLWWMIGIYSTGLNCLVALSNDGGSSAPPEMEQVNLLMFIKNACICGYYTWPTCYLTTLCMLWNVMLIIPRQHEKWHQRDMWSKYGVTFNVLLPLIAPELCFYNIKQWWRYEQKSDKNILIFKHPAHY